MYEMRRLNRALDLWAIEVGCFYQNKNERRFIIRELQLPLAISESFQWHKRVMTCY